MAEQKQNKTKQERKERVQDSRIEEEMQKAYIDYAMSVIVSRALPDMADGLKPVQRRILYAMYQLGLRPDKPTRKAARIVGDTMAKYHPHGDLAIYDALARMTQDFSLRYPLVQGQGNWGSIDGDSPAAMRYTEARLARISEEILSDIDKETVKFRPNFDNSLKEPEILPAKLPNLLINGASGIAVGMATNIPPHNLGEVIDAVVKVIKNPKVDIKQLLRLVPAPDFPTAGYVTRQGVEDLYKTGRGYLTLRGKVSVEEHRGRERIIISELPYQVNKINLITDIAKLVRSKRLQDISNLRDESSRGNIRIVIELRRGANSKLIINRLFEFTQLQTRFNGMMLALVDGQPRILNLKQMLELFVKHRKNVVEKRSKFELRKAEDRAHIVEGLLLVLKSVGPIIALIKKSKNRTEAAIALTKRLRLSQKQAEAILDMRLQQLTVLEHRKLNDERKSLLTRIFDLKKILGSETVLLGVIRKELLEVKRKYADERRTKILERAPTYREKDLIAKEGVIVTLTAKGYIKRMPPRLYKEQKRGGKGITGTELTTGDVVSDILMCNTHDSLIFFTNTGKAYSLQAYQVPEASRYSKGRSIVNLLSLRNEKVATTLPVKEFGGDLVLITAKGMIKKMSLSHFEKIRKSGIVAINLPEDDELIATKFVTSKEDILLGTSQGIAIRFASSQVRGVGRTAYGVIGIRLGKEDCVVGAEILPLEKEQLEKTSILTITEKGYGKRTQAGKYRKTKRAGKGITNIRLSEKTGEVAGIISTQEGDSLIVTTARGMVIRTAAKSIRLAGRITQGVRIIRLAENDRVIDLGKIREE